MEATTMPAIPQASHFLRACEIADATRNAVTTQRAESHRQGNSTYRISGKVSYRMKLGENIMNVETAPRMVSDHQTGAWSRLNLLASKAAMAVAITRKTAMK